MRKKASGIEKVGEGRYQVRVVVTNPKTGKRRDVKRIVDAVSVIDAERKRVELRVEATAVKPARVRARRRFGDAASSWFSAQLPALKKSTADLYADVLDLHLTPVLGEMFVDAITKEDILELRDKWAAKGARPATVNGRLRILRQCLSVICDEAGIADPSKHVAGVRMPRATTPKGLEPHDAGKLLKALGGMTDDRGPAYYALALLLASTGLRWGEATALLWSDIDLERLDVVVSRAHVRGHVDTTKTDCVKRLPLAPLVADALRRLRTKQLRDQAAGLEAGVVFPSRVGTLMRPSSFRKRLATACKTASVRPITPHGFRHTMNNAAKRIASGDVVRSITGHLTAEMTEHYSWVNADEKRETVGNVIRLFGVGDPPMTHESGSSGGRSDSEKSSAG